MKFEVELNAEQIRHLQSLNRNYPEPYKWYSEISPIPPMLEAVANDSRLQPIEIGKSYIVDDGWERHVKAVEHGFVYFMIDNDSEMYRVAERSFRSVLK